MIGDKRMRKRFVEFMSLVTGALCLSVLCGCPVSDDEGAKEADAMLKSLEVATIGGTKQTIQIRKDGGFAEVEFRATKLKMLFSSNKTSNALVIVLYESATGLSWREFRRGHYGNAADEQVGVSQFLKEYRFYLLSDRIVGFRTHFDDVVVLEYIERQPSLDEAVKSAIAGIKPNLKAYGSPFRDTKVINFRDILGHNFCFIKGSALWGHALPHLIDVDRRQSQWIISVEGPNEIKTPTGSVKDKAVLVLGDDYAVQEASINGDKVYPTGRKYKWRLNLDSNVQDSGITPGQ